MKTSSLKKNQNHSPFIAWSLVLIQFTSAAYLFLSGSVIAVAPLLVLLQVLGLLTGVWAILSMRIGNFNITPNIKSGSKLIMSGPYRYIRHPMYAALLMLTLAIVVDSFSIQKMIAWLILLTDLLIKLSYEERLLRKEREAYAVYATKTKRLLPFIFLL